jgi:hypothetical protein
MAALGIGHQLAVSAVTTGSTSNHWASTIALN